MKFLSDANSNSGSARIVSYCTPWIPIHFVISVFSDNTSSVQMLRKSPSALNLSPAWTDIKSSSSDLSPDFIWPRYHVDTSGKNIVLRDCRSGLPLYVCMSLYAVAISRSCRSVFIQHYFNGLSDHFSKKDGLHTSNTDHIYHTWLYVARCSAIRR